MGDEEVEDDGGGNNNGEEDGVRNGEDLMFCLVEGFFHFLLVGVLYVEGEGREGGVLNCRLLKSYDH